MNDKRRIIEKFVYAVIVALSLALLLLMAALPKQSKETNPVYMKF